MRCFSVHDLREKWKELPATRAGRMFASDLMLLNDEELLAYWTKCQAETCTPAIRGWYQQYYKWLVSGKKVLEIGPGIGLDGVFFAQQGAQVTFADINRESLALVERICRIKNIAAQYYYIDNFERYEFTSRFDIFLAIGSLINTPLDFARTQVHALSGFLKPGGKVLFLGYPFERFEASGAKDGSEFGKMTDGERTPWVEWYDRKKIQYLFGDDFSIDMAVNFGRDNLEFNFFEITKTDNNSVQACRKNVSPANPVWLINHLTPPPPIWIYNLERFITGMAHQWRESTCLNLL